MLWFVMFRDVFPLAINWMIDKNMYYTKLCDCLSYLVITYEVRDEATRANCKWSNCKGMQRWSKEQIPCWVTTAVINLCPSFWSSVTIAQQFVLWKETEATVQDAPSLRLQRQPMFPIEASHCWDLFQTLRWCTSFGDTRFLFNLWGLLVLKTVQWQCLPLALKWFCC